jgi:hypothetical protein
VISRLGLPTGTSIKVVGVMRLIGKYQGQVARLGYIMILLELEHPRRLSK